MSVTSIRIRDYILGNVIGMLPGTSVSIYIGVNLNNLQQISEGYGLGPWQPVYITIGIVLMIVLTSLMVSYSKSELDRILKQDEESMLNKPDSLMASLENQSPV